MDPERLTLRAMIEGYQPTQALAVTARLGLADLLAAGSVTSAVLAAATGTDPDALLRLLRALAAVGVVTEGPTETFQLTARGDGLRVDAPDSLAASAVQAGQPELWQAWGALAHSIMTGQAAFPQVHGRTAWQYRAQHPASGAQFAAVMAEGAQHVAQTLVTAYPWAAVGTVVDGGGGIGVVLAALLAAHRHLRGVLVEQPAVIAQAMARLQGRAVAARCTLVAGDFFVSVPTGGDVYLLKGILHDWDDAAAHQILTTCRRAMPGESWLLVIEQLLPEQSGADRVACFLDLHMLVIHGARERTEADYRALLAQAGFQVTRVVPTPTGLSLIEGTVRTSR